MSEHLANIHELGKVTIADAHLTEAYRSSALRLFTHRLDAKSQVPGFEHLRDQAHELKREGINNLARYVEQFATQIECRGGHVHWALTGEEACEIVLEIVQQAGAREVVKAKSMVSEEMPTIFPARLLTCPANCPATRDCGVLGLAAATSVVLPVNSRLMTSTGGSGARQGLPL